MKKSMKIIVLFFLGIQFTNIITKNIAIIGTGYVGSITGIGLASLNNHVICVDIDKEKVAQWQSGICPLYEEGLSQALKEVLEKENIEFTTDLEYAIKNSSIIFIAVGTPSFVDGSADLSYFNSALETLIDLIEKQEQQKLVVIKSTVPIGTCKLVQEKIKQITNKIIIISNPEFLREGKAISDFNNPDRIVIGSDSSYAIQELLELYEPFKQRSVPFVITDLSSAEAIKYGSNVFLAQKITFINELANLSEELKFNIKDAALGIGLDKRIGQQFLIPGPGFGGSCLPKDIKSLLFLARKHGIECLLLEAVNQSNKLQKIKVVKKLETLLGSVEGKIITVLGLAFKADTDDIRESSALRVIDYLLKHGAIVHVYDPKALNNSKKFFSKVYVGYQLFYFDDPYEALNNVDAIIFLTEWEEFKMLDYQKIAHKSKNKPIIIDARNILNKKEMEELGFTYGGIGHY